MNQVLEWIAAGLELTLWAAIAALPLALAAVVLDAALGRWMSARVRCAMWVLVAVRLLLPVAPGSPLSFQNAWRLVQSPQAESVARDLSPPPAVRVQPLERVATSRVVVSRSPAGESSPFVTASGGIDWESVTAAAVIVAWFTGVVVLLTRAVVASARFARRLRSVPCCDEPSLVQTMVTVCKDLGVRRIPRVKYVTELPAPALFGVFRPTICLPAESRSELSDAQLRMILLHEVMHIRRFDSVQAWVLTVVRAVHWFNPVAWLATGRVALYREEACDDAVRRFTHPVQRSVYTDLLLQFAGDRPAGRVGFVGLCFARPVRHLAARIRAFARGADARRMLPRTAIVGMLALLAIAGLTDAASSTSEQTEPQTVAEWMASPQREIASAPRKAEWTSGAPVGLATASAPVEERIYDVSAALAKLEEFGLEANARSWLLAYVNIPTQRPQAAKFTGEGAVQLRVTMTPQEHESLAGMLDSLSTIGPWQVSVTTRTLSSARADVIGNIDWRDAVKFAQFDTEESSAWQRDAAETDAENSAKPSTDKRGSLSMESISREFTPYLAVIVDKKTMDGMIERYQGGRRANLAMAPKVTLFSGQVASVRDECMIPFVLGVHYVKGELATAAQPDIVTLTEGMRLDVRPSVVDAEALDLQCRLTVSEVDRVGTTKLPGQEVTVQSPRLSQRTISARYKLAPGETLLIASLPADGAEGEKGVTYYAISAEWFPDTFEKP
jgi:bla regulator protein BlaR1